jgi:hypothetical protein
MHIVNGFDYGMGLFFCFMSLVYVLIARLHGMAKNPRCRLLPRLLLIAAVFWLIEGIRSMAQGVGVHSSSPFGLTMIGALLVLLGAQTVVTWDFVKELRSTKSTARPE